MKIKKSDLELVTEQGASICMLAVASLAMAGCPLPPLYEMAEEFAGNLKRLREDLELEKSESLDELSSGQISAKIAMAVQKRKTQKRNPLGFQVPEHDSDPSKMN